MIPLLHYPVTQVAFGGETLRLEVLSHGLLRIVLARPQARNAINAAMIAEFAKAFAWMEAHSAQARLLLLQGEGPVFCAGADLAYMHAQAAVSEAENLEDARRLGRIFHQLAGCPVPVVCYVQGAALGGGLGLAACSDFVVAEGNADFATPEVRLGLVAGVIGPYVVRRLGLAHAAPLMLSGIRIPAREALRMGLVQRVLEPGEDGAAVLSEVLRAFLLGGPQAVRRSRELLRILAPLPSPEAIDASVRAIAQARVSPEAQAGLEARTAKIPPPWGKGLP